MRPPIPALTGLRFIAALSVMVGHSVVQLMRFQGPAPAWQVGIHQLTGIGMPLFFVLSGFVIQYNYSHTIIAKPGRGLYGFFVARFARLYPLYIVCLLFDLGFKWGYLDLPAATGRALPYYLTLTHSWFYLQFDGTDLIRMFGLMPQISWSISTEMFFYLCFPFICLLIVRLHSIRAVIVTITTFTVVATLILIVVGLNYGATIRFGASWFEWFAYLSPYLELLQFTLGCLCAHLFMRVAHFPIKPSEQRIGMMVTVASLVAIAGLFCVFYLIPYTVRLDSFRALRTTFGFAPAMATLIFCCARYRNPIVSFMSSPKIVLCGEASYSMYMLHYLVIDAFRLRVGPIESFGVGFANFLMWMVTLASIIGLSLVSWQVIEVPARRWLRKALALKRPVAAVPQPAE